MLPKQNTTIQRQKIRSFLLHKGNGVCDQNSPFVPISGFVYARMAYGIARRCIGAIWSQPSIDSTFAVPSRLVGATWILNTSVRGYTAAAGRHKQKTSSTAKGTHKTAPLKSASTPKVSAKTSARTTHTELATSGTLKLDDTAAPSRPVPHVPAPEHQTLTSSSVPGKTRSGIHRAAGGISYKVPEKQDSQTMTEEEQIAQVDQIIAMSKYFPTADPWGQRVETLGESFSDFNPSFFIRSCTTDISFRAIPSNNANFLVSQEKT